MKGSNEGGKKIKGRKKPKKGRKQRKWKGRNEGEKKAKGRKKGREENIESGREGREQKKGKSNAIAIGSEVDQMYKSGCGQGWAATMSSFPCRVRDHFQPHFKAETNSTIP